MSTYLVGMFEVGWFFLANSWDSDTTAANPASEELIWRVFKCLSLGLAVMETGKESLTAPVWQRNLIHFDIKPDNILIGSFDTDEHKSIRATKVNSVPASTCW